MERRPPEQKHDPLQRIFPYSKCDGDWEDKMKREILQEWRHEHWFAEGHGKQMARIHYNIVKKAETTNNHRTTEARLGTGKL